MNGESRPKAAPQRPRRTVATVTTTIDTVNQVDYNFYKDDGRCCITEVFEQVHRPHCTLNQAACGKPTTDRILHARLAISENFEGRWPL